MRTCSRALSIALATALTVVTAGCGNSDGGGDAGGAQTSVSDEARPYVDAFAQSMKDSNLDEDEIQLSDDQINCIAPRFVNIIGSERLVKNGVTPEDFASDDTLDFSKLKISEKDGNALYDTLGDCDVNLREVLTASFAEDEDMTPAMTACMEEAFTDENLRLMMVSTMVNGDDAMEEDPKLSPMMAQLMGCAFMGMADEG